MKALWLVLGIVLVPSAARADDEAPAAPAIPETVVTAPVPPAHQPREDQAAAATVVLPRESPRAHDDLGTLVAEVPGVIVTRSGSLGSFATLTLRGSNPDEVRIFVDGVPLNIAEGGAVDVSTLPLGDVERVEIYRGSSPLVFGESALGGIVAITTRTPGAPRATARAGAGSFDTMFADATGGGRVGRLRLYLGAHGLWSRGGFGYHMYLAPLNPDDDADLVRQHNEIRQADGVLRAALDLPGGRSLSLGALAFARDGALPSSELTPALVARFRSARGIAFLRYQSPADLGEGGRLAAQLFASGQRDGLSDPDRAVASVPTVTHDTTLSVGATMHARKAPAPWIAVAALAEGRAETFRPVNDAAPMPVGVPARRLVGVGGAEIDLWWRRLDLDVIPSARVEAVSDQLTMRDAISTAAPLPEGPITRVLPVARLGIVKPFRPAGLQVALKANGGYYARIPTFLELYGNTGRLLGNPALLPERGVNADLALWLDGGRGRLELSSRTTLFGALARDLIAWEYGAWSARAANLSSARVFGVEQELRAALGRHARAVAQVTYTNAIDTGPATDHHGKQLALHPRWRAYGRPELVRLPVGGRLALGAFVDADLTAGNYYDAANIAPAATRLLIGAGVTAELPRWGLAATLSGQNLDDLRTADFPNWPLPGRSLFLALAWTSALGDAHDNTRSD